MESTNILNRISLHMNKNFFRIEYDFSGSVSGKLDTDWAGGQRVRWPLLAALRALAAKLLASPLSVLVHWSRWARMWDGGWRIWDGVWRTGAMW